MPLSVFIRKLLRAALTVFLMVTLVFIVLRITGDPAIAILGDEADSFALDAYRERWGLDRSILEQYLIFLRQIAMGDFGRSYIEARSAFGAVMDRMPRTLLLMGITAVLSLAIGIPAGICAALNHGRLADRTIMSVTVAGFCMPNFVVGVLLIFIFAVMLGLLPTAGAETPSHLVLPVVTMVTGEAAVFARYTRAAMLRVLHQPYVQTALAKGMPWPRVVIRHALPNTAIPIVTISGFFVGSIIAGAVITETVFAWPGVGRLFVTSVANRDLPVVQVIIILVATSMVITNLTVDILYTWLDPRIRDLVAGRHAHGRQG